MEVVGAALAAFGGRPAGGAGVQHDVRVVRRDELLALRLAAVGDEQGDVAVLQGGEVADQGVEPVGTLDEHQPPGAAEDVVGEVPGPLRELGEGDRAVLGPQRDGGPARGEVEDRAREGALGRGEEQGHPQRLT